MGRRYPPPILDVPQSSNPKNCRIRARATLKPQKYVAALPPATHAATTFQPSTPPLCSYYDERFAEFSQLHARYAMLVAAKSGGL